IATSEEDWLPFREASPPSLAALLADLARRVDMGYYSKNPVRPRKPTPPRSRPRRGDKHVSTHRLLNPHLFPPKKKGPGSTQKKAAPAQRPPDPENESL